MQRRDFLTRGLAAALMPGLALADAGTYRDFRAGLARHPHLCAFAGTQSEMLAAEASIEGSWPKALAGTFYRNGPGRLERHGERYDHWFDGDGMAHAWRIHDGRISHVGRMVGTHKYREESAAGEFLYPGFGTAIHRRPLANNDTINTANTNLLPHAGKLYALWEGGSATELDPATLASRGIKTWRPDLAAMPFSAHPKVEPSGDLWNFGALPGTGKLVLWHIKPDGSLGRIGLLDIQNLAMVHDFVVTERYMVFLVPPFRVEPQAGKSFLAAHQWQAHGALRAVVVNKADFSLRRIIEMPAAMLFHFGNGWDTHDTIHLDACLYANDEPLAEIASTMRGEPWASSPRGRSSLFTLNLTTGTAHEAPLLTGTEFPRVADAIVGRRHSQLFVLTDQPGQPSLNGVARIDLSSGRVDRYHFGKDWVVEEHVPVARPDGKGSWLVGPAFDVRRQQTVLNVFDATNLAAGPLARARLPHAVPLGFHGNFMKA